MKKTPPVRIVEIHVHRSLKNKRLGHAVALLFPCDHHKYLGLTLYKGPVDSMMYRSQDARILKFEDYEITDKDVCKLCPQDEFWLDDIDLKSNLDEFADVLEAVDDF